MEMIDPCNTGLNLFIIEKNIKTIIFSGYPKNYGNYYGRNQFHNFKDFADLKKHNNGRRRFWFNSPHGR